MADLVATAAASTRPAECSPTRAHQTIWTRAQTPRLDAYCRHLAFAEARLDRDPNRALAEARAAEALLPEHAAPQVMAARALLRLGRLDESVAAFSIATARDRRSADAPLAARDRASAHRRALRLDIALDAYRRLVPLTALLPRPLDGVLVLLEAAHTAMASASTSATPDLTEAVTFAREATRLARGEVKLDAALTLALVLDRSGQPAAADAVLGETTATEAWPSDRTPDVVDATDADALAALALERVAPADARHRWERFLAKVPETHPWARAARARVARLGSALPGGSRKRRR